MKGVFWQEGETLNNSTSLIVSLLVRYPEIATVSFDPESKNLQLTFVLSRPLEPEEFGGFEQKTQASVDVFLQVSGRAGGELTLSYTNFDQKSFVEIRRDVDTLSQEEISMLQDLVVSRFGDDLIRDQNEDSLAEEELQVQEEIIDHMLEDLKDSRQDRTLIGFREEGRVLVFNRSGWHHK